MKTKGKGNPGKKGNEGKARRLINKGKNKGMTNAQIAKAMRRSNSTLTQIANGEIANPPDDLVKRLDKAVKNFKSKK